MIQIRKRTTPILIIIFLLTVSTISVNAGVIKSETVRTLNEGSIIYVDDDNTQGPWDGTQEHPYRHIQDGINAANNGDTVFVYNGLYKEWIDINKEIKLDGQYKTNTIIDVKREGGDWNHIVEITADNVNVSGFTIKNSTMFSAGIYIISDFCNIYENIITDNWYHAIYLENANNNQIHDNSLSYSTKAGGYGVRCEGSSNNMINNNEINNVQCGIGFYGGQYNTVFQNVISKSEWDQDIFVGASNHNSIAENILEDSILIRDSYYLEIIDNEFQSKGINLLDQYNGLWDTHIINNNTVSGRPIYYFKNTDNIIVPDDASQVILANCDNCEIKNLDLSNIDIEVAITLINSSHNTISDNLLSSKSKSEYTNGIRLGDSSNYNIIHDNTIQNFQDVSPDFTLAGAFYISGSSNNQIFDNNIINNMHGLLIFSSGNTVYRNNFLNNNHYDVFGTNYLNQGDSGNYWSDYPYFDEDGDNIGDTPYTLPGDGNSDHYPLMTAIGITSNNPDKPVILGDPTGKINKKMLFKATSDDPDNDLIRYLFDWGDNTYCWTDHYDSGVTAEKDHTWTTKGTYIIKVKAKDIYGYESDWETFTVSITKSRQKTDLFINFLERFIEKFPFFATILKLVNLKIA